MKTNHIDSVNYVRNVQMVCYKCHEKIPYAILRNGYNVCPLCEQEISLKKCSTSKKEYLLIDKRPKKNGGQKYD